MDDDINDTGQLGMPVSHFLKKHFGGTVIGCGSYSIETGAKAINQKQFELLAFGRLAIANPSLVELIKNNQESSILSFEPKMLEVLLEVKGVREPHWHPNTVELTYCLEGSGVMTIFSPGAGHNTFTLEPGCISFVPMGSIHHIENRGQTPLRMLICFNHEKPEDQDFSAGVAAMPKHILAKTIGTSPTFFDNFQTDPKTWIIDHGNTTY